MKKFLCAILALCMLLTLVACGTTASDPAVEGEDAAVASGDPEIIRFGVGTAGSNDQIQIEGMSNIINKYTDLKTSTVMTGGGIEIMKLMQLGDLEAGFGGTLNIVAATKNEADFATTPMDPENMVQMFAFTSWQDPIITLKSSGIETMEDLEGKTIAVPPEGSATIAMIRLVIEAYGLTDKVTMEPMSWQNGFDAMKDGRIDGWVANWACLDKSSNIIELESTKDYNILAVDDAHMAKVIEANPGVASFYLDSSSSNQIAEGETVQVPGFSGVALIHADISEEAVYKMVMAVFSHTDELAVIHSSFSRLDSVATAGAVSTVPFHPGAAKALKELGKWDDSFIVYGE